MFGHLLTDQFRRNSYSRKLNLIIKDKSISSFAVDLNMSVDQVSDKGYPEFHASIFNFRYYKLDKYPLFCATSNSHKYRKAEQARNKGYFHSTLIFAKNPKMWTGSTDMGVRACVTQSIIIIIGVVRLVSIPNPNFDDDQSERGILSAVSSRVALYQKG